MNPLPGTHKTPPILGKVELRRRGWVSLNPLFRHAQNTTNTRQGGAAEARVGQPESIAWHAQNATYTRQDGAAEARVGHPESMAWHAQNTT